MTPAAASRLAAWIAVTHPDVFQELARRAALMQAGKAQGLHGFGDVDDPIDMNFDAESSSWEAPSFDFEAGTEYTGYDDIGSGGIFDLPPEIQDPTFGDADLSSLYNTAPPSWTGTGTASSSSPDTSANPTNASGGSSDSGSSWLSSLGSGLASAAAGVGKFLTSSQGLSSLASVSTAFFNSQAQNAVLQTQVQRAQQGLSPAPITYTTNAQGQLVPVVGNPATGQVAYNSLGQPYVVTPQTLQTMGAGINLPNMTPTEWLLILGAGVLGLAFFL